MKILFIDDDVSRNRFLVRYFEDYKGWKVIWAEAPKEALEKLGEEPGIDVILLDVMMPVDGTFTEEESDMGMNTGILMIDKINEITGGGIPIILLTARQDLHHLVYEKKVKAYLRKPMSGDEVIEAIEEIVGDKK